MAENKNVVNDGKYLEEIVLLIERSISPNSRLEHDVQMPILNSTEGNTTQCDIVIWSGTPPRETITIVEVQDRKSKVKPNDFRGWQMKLEDVGAQHLICVSKQEFPSSIKEKAKQSGNKIQLVNLKEVPKDKIPLNLIKTEFRHVNFEATELFCLVAEFSKEEIEKKGVSKSIIEKHRIQHTANCFSFDGINRFSLFELCRDYCNYNPDDRKGTKTLDFTTEKHPNLFYYYDNQFVQMKLKVEFKFEREVIYIPVSVLSYEQLGDDTLVWLLDVSYKSERGKFEFRAPLVVKGNGKYQLSNFDVNLPVNTNLTMEVKKINEN